MFAAVIASAALASTAAAAIVGASERSSLKKDVYTLIDGTRASTRVDLQNEAAARTEALAKLDKTRDAARTEALAKLDKTRDAARTEALAKLDKTRDGVLTVGDKDVSKVVVAGSDQPVQIGSSVQFNSGAKKHTYLRTSSEGSEIYIGSNDSPRTKRVTVDATDGLCLGSGSCLTESKLQDILKYDFTPVPSKTEAKTEPKTDLGTTTAIPAVPVGADTAATVIDPATQEAAAATADTAFADTTVSDTTIATLVPGGVPHVSPEAPLQGLSGTPVPVIDTPAIEGFTHGPDSWDPKWAGAQALDCTYMVSGPAMAPRSCTRGGYNRVGATAQLRNCAAHASGWDLAPYNA
jgi:hypothetical protein